MISNPKVVAVTGTIASGKSLVGRVLEEHGQLVIDTDKVVHDIYASDAELQNDLEQLFGKEILDDSGSIDRARLGAIVFNDQKKRAELESLIHPAVLRQCEKLVSKANREVVFILVPLLFEAGLEKHWDEVWTVITDEPILRQRLKTRNGLSDDEIQKRLDAQLSQEEKAARANHVINNSGTKEQTGEQVKELLLHTATI